jgi:hypothetical protein
VLLLDVVSVRIVIVIATGMRMKVCILFAFTFSLMIPVSELMLPFPPLNLQILITPLHTLTLINRIFIFLIHTLEFMRHNRRNAPCIIVVIIISHPPIILLLIIFKIKPTPRLIQQL